MKKRLKRRQDDDRAWARRVVAGLIQEQPDAIATVVDKVRTGVPAPEAAGLLRKCLEASKARSGGGRQAQALAKKYAWSVLVELAAQMGLSPDDGVKFVEGLFSLSKDMSRVEQALREIVVPPPSSAANIEVIAMAAAHLFAACGLSQFSPQEFDAVALEDVLPGDALTRSRLATIAEMVACTTGDVEAMAIAKREREVFAFPEPEFGKWLMDWRSNAYARLEVGARLGAALALTDGPKVEARAPWPAWSLQPPDGLFVSDRINTPVARVWCRGTEPRFVLVNWVAGPNRSPFPHARKLGRFDEIEDAPLKSAIRCLVIGACLVASDPERVRRSGSHGASRSVVGRRHGPPPEGAHYQLAAPVQIDLRERLSEVLSGRHRGVGPKVQFLVRGHWRNQVCGLGRATRKLIWIEPFWKGPEEARILLRPHQT